MAEISNQQMFIAVMVMEWRWILLDQVRIAAFTWDILLALASIQFLCIVQRALDTDGCNVTRVTAVTHGTNSDSWISTFMRQCISTERCLLASKELLWSILLPQSRSKPHQDEASWCQHTALAEISKSKVLHFATTLSQNMPFFVNTAISNMLP